MALRPLIVTGISLGAFCTLSSMGFACSGTAKNDANPQSTGSPEGGASDEAGSEAGTHGNDDDGGATVVVSDAGGCIGADAGALALTSDSKPITFVVAAPDPVTGDWMGQGGYVAQVFSTPDGKWKANLLTAFETPNATPVAVLDGTPTSCNTMTFSGSGWSGSIGDGHFTAQNGSASFDLQHVLRSSSTLGAAPPAGAVVLFDGTNLDQWVEKAGQNWLQAAGPARWKIVDGAIEVVPGTDSIISNQLFGDCTIHVEFRCVGTPTHSGIFPEARYQTTILQDYGAYSGNLTGNFGNETPVINPVIHADRAPLEWQTLDIVFQAPRFNGATKTTNANAQVTLNGTSIFDATSLTPPTGAAGRFAESATGPILLEYHGMPVQYRNIWVLPAGM